MFESADSIDFSSLLMGNESKITSGPESMYIDKPFIDSSLCIGFPRFSFKVASKK
jgi:hypothetical protein